MPSKTAKRNAIGGLLGACISTEAAPAPAPAPAPATPARSRTACQSRDAVAHADEPSPRKRRRTRLNRVTDVLAESIEFFHEEHERLLSENARLVDDLGNSRLENGRESRRHKRELRSKDQEIKTLNRRNEVLRIENYDLRLELMREKATKRTQIDDLEQEHDNQRQSWMDEKERLQQRLGELEETGRDQPRTHPIVVVDEQRGTRKKVVAANAPPQMSQSAKRKRATGPAHATQLITPEKTSRKAGDGLMGSETRASADTSIWRSTRRRHVLPNYIDNDSDSDSDDWRMKQVNRTRKLQTQAGKRKRIDGDFAESEREASDTDDEVADNKASKGGNGGSAGGWYLSLFYF